jgi:hypothetical protein
MANIHTGIDTQESTRTITNDEIVDQFQPVGDLLWEVIDDARELTSVEIAAAAYPRLRRSAHLRRISGSTRWMHVAEGIVERRGDLPDGFSVESTEEQHNQGIYIFRFPGGVFTVKRTPHKGPDEGAYLQEQIEGFEEVALEAGIDADADLIVFLSVSEAKEPRLIVTHPTLPAGLVVGLEAIRTPVVAQSIDPDRTIPRPAVRSTRRSATTESADAAGEDS